MRIASWNINGIRACARKGLGEWLDGCEAGIVAVQEVRARLEQVPEDLRDRNGWHLDLVSAERPGYSGVALFARRAPDSVRSEIGEPEVDREGRLQIARFGSLRLVNAYFPNGNGKNRDLSRIPYKLDFYCRLYDELEESKQRGERILVMGDFNTAHREIDLARPKQNRETSGFRTEEREELDRWLRHGWVDTFRLFCEEGGHYTWWSQRFGVRERNIGWRIDYILASPGAVPFVRSAAIHPEVTGSDHCPLSVEVDEGIFEARPDST
ncbi:MAG: exodeoxyribonuclease III [bacterium]|nr:exodeoxyribonuclease III [bacterium]